MSRDLSLTPEGILVEDSPLTEPVSGLKSSVSTPKAVEPSGLGAHFICFHGATVGTDAWFLWATTPNHQSLHVEGLSRGCANP